MAQLIALTSYNGVEQNSAQDPTATTTQTVYINPEFIVSVQTRPTAYNTTGITNVQYNLLVNNSNVLITLVVTQTAAAINTAVNSSIASSASSGRATLVAGTVTVSVPGLTAANNVVVTLHTANTTTLTTEYQAVAGTDEIVIRANVAAGTINVADVSTLVYAVVS